VLILPHSSPAQAQEVVDRIRAKLAETCLRATSRLHGQLRHLRHNYELTFRAIAENGRRKPFMRKGIRRDRAMIAGQHQSGAPAARRAVEHPGRTGSELIADAG